MNDTLNSIDEHITDLSTPRQSQAPRRHREDSESDYSTHLDRQSFVSGPETDEEDNDTLDEATVRSWDHIQTASYLEHIGLDPAHCQIFKEQEITGDVLLDMDQSFINMKEYDFGVMGRRLKTWHKVRDFQHEVKGTSSKRTSDRGQNSSVEDFNRFTMQSMAGPSPLARSQERILSLRQSQHTPPISEEMADVPHPLQPQPQPQQTYKRASWTAQTPPSSWRATMGAESPAPARNSNDRHSRRHSSIDFGSHPELDSFSVPSTSSHKKQSSWSLAGSTAETTPSSSIRPSTKVDDSVGRLSRATLGASPMDIDRGYFSGNDIDDRKTRNRLSKSPRIGHTRQTSMAETSTRTPAVKRHARLSSTGSVRDPSMLPPSVASKAYHEMPVKGRMRSASARATSGASSSGGLSPAVTNLETGATSTIGSPAIEKMKMQDRARKLMGFRTTSEAVTFDEKTNASKSPPYLESSDFVASPVTGNTTPSATPSIDMDTPEDSIRGSDTPGLSNRNTLLARPRTKQYTSAYTHGLLKMTPAEARKNCDHYGWMKKKSSGIMTTWKPRLFILRGRRLSYYYSESDTEERGIIDISSHKVLVANDDPMITIHASVTGATKPNSTPRISDPSASPTKLKSMSVFYFKLVPPKSGLSRAVQFTKPAIHYFQVDTVTEGRLWMGEIMKATIEHDLTSFETTNKQKTISLAKARARKERPPELDDTKKDEEGNTQDEKTLRQSGLMIQGLEAEDDLARAQVSEQEQVPPSPKAVSTLGLEPRVSLIPKKEDLVDTIPEEENKENNMVAGVRTSGTHP